MHEPERRQLLAPDEICAVLDAARVTEQRCARLCRTFLGQIELRAQQWRLGRAQAREGLDALACARLAAAGDRRRHDVELMQPVTCPDRRRRQRHRTLEVLADAPCVAQATDHARLDRLAAVQAAQRKMTLVVALAELQAVFHRRDAGTDPAAVGIGQGQPRARQQGRTVCRVARQQACGLALDGAKVIGVEPGVELRRLGSGSAAQQRQRTKKRRQASVRRFHPESGDLESGQFSLASGVPHPRPLAMQAFRFLFPAPRRAASARMRRRRVMDCRGYRR